jgi:hypothetical protein
MSEKAFHRENLARIENRIFELKRRISGLQERLQTLEAAKLNTEPTYDLLAILTESLEVMELRRQLTLGDIRAGEVIGGTGCKWEI